MSGRAAAPGGSRARARAARRRGSPGAWLAVAAALLSPAIGRAATPALLAVGPVDEARPALVRQLRQALCAAVECVPWGTVSEGRELDLARVRAAGIDGVLMGAVVARGRRPVVTLSLFAHSAAPVARWRLGLRPDGTVSERALGGLVQDLERRLGALVRGRAVPEAPGSAGPDHRPPAAGSSDGGEALERLRDDDEAVPQPEPAPPARAPWLALEAAGAIGRRELSFQGTAPSPGPLRGQRVPALIAPGLRLELRPGAWWTDGALAGISLHVAYARAAGVETTVGGVAHPSRMSWLSAGVGWRSAPPGAERRSFSAGASWERREATVTPAIPGLADRRLSGVKASAGFAQPLGRTSLFVGAGYVRWLDAPELVSGHAAFFPGGSAWGVDAEAGADVRIGARWSLRLAVEYATTRYRLARDPQGLYEARSARDDLLSSRFSVRVEL